MRPEQVLGFGVRRVEECHGLLQNINEQLFPI